jgi:hypothetical protein
MNRKRLLAKIGVTGLVPRQAWSIPTDDGSANVFFCWLANYSHANKTITFAYDSWRDTPHHRASTDKMREAAQEGKPCIAVMQKRARGTGGDFGVASAVSGVMSYVFHFTPEFTGDRVVGHDTRMERFD